MKKVEYTRKRNPKSIFFEWRIRKISNRISEIIRIFEKKGQITKIATTLFKFPENTPLIF
jgi:transposase